MSNVDDNEVALEGMAAIVGAELARMIVRRNGKTWVRMSVWTKPENLTVDLFESQCQVGWTFMLDEMRDGREVVGYVERSIESMVKQLKSTIKDREI